MFRALRVALPLALFILCVFGIGWRTRAQYQTPGKFDPAKQGQCDFHNGVYYPGLAWRERVNPYSETFAQRYPVDRQIPFFSPHIVALHAPLSFLPLHAAEVAYFALSVLIALIMSRMLAIDAGSMCYSTMLWIAIVLVISRAGHITLFTGYFTWELALGTFVALRYSAQRPTWGALGLMLAAGKPTYALPLGFLLLCRGHFRAVMLGTSLTILFAGLSVVWLLSNSPQIQQGNDSTRSVTERWIAASKSFAQDIAQTQAVHVGEPSELSVNTWTRVDLLAIITKWMAPKREGVIQTSTFFASAKEDAEKSTYEPSGIEHLIVMLLVLLPCGFVLWRNRVRTASLEELPQHQATGITASIVVLGTLVSVYHQSTDTMLVMGPLVGLSFWRDPAWQNMHRSARYALMLILGAVLMNYASTANILDRMQWTDIPHRLITSLNGVALFAAWIVLMATLRRRAY